MTQGDSRHGPVAMIMTEDAKTENHTAGGPCGAYIELPCKFAACRDIVEKIAYAYAQINQK